MSGSWYPDYESEDRKADDPANQPVRLASMRDRESGTVTIFDPERQTEIGDGCWMSARASAVVELSLGEGR